MAPPKTKEKKRSRKVLSIKEKIDLIKDHRNNMSVILLSEKYGVGKQTVRDLIKHKTTILKYASESDSLEGLKKRHTLKKAANPNVDFATYEWFRQERFKGTPISGEMISEKAKYFHENLNIRSECTYSSGWLEKFKRRHGIRKLKTSGEKECADYESATLFVEELREYIETEHLSLEQVYNADETSLFWKCLPQSSLASGKELSIDGYKESKERITALLCGNAAGTHKCKLMVIGKSANPRALKNVSSLPVIYKSNKRAWVTQELFLEWFNKNFVPEVRGHLHSIGFDKKCKVLLLLDNCPAHPDVNVMIAEDVIVKYLPPNCTCLIQPMDQGAIRSFKSHYRKLIVQKLVAADSRIEFVKSLNIKTALWTAAMSWDNVTSQVLRNVWNNILAQDEDNDAVIKSDIVIPPGFEIDAFLKWTRCDADVAPFAIVSDAEIIDMVNESQECEPEESSEESDGGNTLQASTLAQAIEASSVLLGYLENNNCPGISEPDLMQLHRIQANLFKQQSLTQRQTTLQEYFK